MEVNEEALSRYKMEPPYKLPDERHILSVVWPRRTRGPLCQYARPLLAPL
ncbi:MAG: hypothetical protein R2911_22835 [Caldilineaceae bacterium]